MDILINQIIASGTISETATGTKELFLVLEIPFLHFFCIFLICAFCLALFYLFFKSIWAD